MGFRVVGIAEGVFRRSPRHVMFTEYHNIPNITSPWKSPLKFGNLIKRCEGEQADQVDGWAHERGRIPELRFRRAQASKQRIQIGWGRP